MEGKVKNGEEFTEYLPLVKTIVSIQINNEHTWTGSILKDDTIITSAECAEEIYVYENLKRNEEPGVRVFYGGSLTGTDYTCSKITHVASQYFFQKSDRNSQYYNKIYAPYNIGLLTVSLFHAMYVLFKYTWYFLLVEKQNKIYFKEKSISLSKLTLIF